MGAAMVAAMTSYTCPITELPYVREIAFEDTSPPRESSAPVHVPRRVLFDGVPVTPEWDGEKWTEGIILAKHVEVALSPEDGTKVTLWVAVDDCTPPFHTDDNPHGHAPATIGGRPFLSPLVEWEVAEPPVDPEEWALPAEATCGCESHTYGAEQPWGFPLCTGWQQDPPTWVRCVVYVAKVTVK